MPLFGGSGRGLLGQSAAVRSQKYAPNTTRAEQCGLERKVRMLKYKCIIETDNSETTVDYDIFLDKKTVVLHSIT